MEFRFRRHLRLQPVNGFGRGLEMQSLGLGFEH